MLQIVLPRILKAFRAAEGVTQEKAAERAGVSPLTWHRWETGKNAPSSCQLADLARAMRQTLFEFSVMVVGALHHHFSSEKAAREHVEGDAAAASRAFLDAVCTELRRATTNLEAVARQAKGTGDPSLFAVLWAAADEARSALDRVHAMLMAAAAAVAGTEAPDES